MPAKTIKLSGGRKVHLFSVRLPNGNLVIITRMPHNRKIGEWKEFPPGSGEYKRWFGLAIDGPDPRDDPKYKARMEAIYTSPEYVKWLANPTGEPAMRTPEELLKELNDRKSRLTVDKERVAQKLADVDKQLAALKTSKTEPEPKKK